MIKKIFISISVLLLALIAFITIYAVDADKNRGYHFGYYGEYNRIVDAIEKLPNVEITKSYAHHDISLEEIWIELKTEEGKDMNLDIGQNEGFRKLSGRDLVEALRVRIESLSPTSQSI